MTIFTILFKRSNLFLIASRILAATVTIGGGGRGGGGEGGRVSL